MSKKYEIIKLCGSHWTSLVSYDALVQIIFFIHNLYNYIYYVTGYKRHFEATEAKILRVAMSSFYDMLDVFLKCLQEFDPSQ